MDKNTTVKLLLRLWHKSSTVSTVCGSHSGDTVEDIKRIIFSDAAYCEIPKVEKLREAPKVQRLLPGL